MNECACSPVRSFVNCKITESSKHEMEAISLLPNGLMDSFTLYIRDTEGRGLAFIESHTNDTGFDRSQVFS